MELFRYVGDRIRELRSRYGGGSGISQEALAKALKVTANTISRWETATYRPNLEDLDALSRFFGVAILEFFPKEEAPADQRVSALLRAARDLPAADIEELQKYAEFRRARALYAKRSAKKGAGRPKGNEN